MLPARNASRANTSPPSPSCGCTTSSTPQMSQGLPLFGVWPLVIRPRMRAHARHSQLPQRPPQRIHTGASQAAGPPDPNHPRLLRGRRCLTCAVVSDVLLLHIVSRDRTGQLFT